MNLVLQLIDQLLLWYVLLLWYSRLGNYLVELWHWTEILDILRAVGISWDERRGRYDVSRLLHCKIYFNWIYDLLCDAIPALIARLDGLAQHKCPSSSLAAAWFQTSMLDIAPTSWPSVNRIWHCSVRQSAMLRRQLVANASKLWSFIA